MPKIQGEGDHESARRYNQHTTQHVQDMGEQQIAEDAAQATTGESPEALAEARRVGQSRAKAGDQDLRDAETFRALREKANE